MSIGQNFYGDQELQDITNLSNQQSLDSLGYGDRAARYADPFMDSRPQYVKALSRLTRNPGSFASSPVYKFAYDQGLEALNRKGPVRSGAKLAALTKYGQDMASQQYFNQAKLLSDLATSGSSPAAAGIAYERGTNRSQDQAQLAAAARAAGNGSSGSRGTYGGAPSTPWWMQGSMPASPSDALRDQVNNERTAYNAGTAVYNTYSGQDPRSMSLAQLNAEGSMYGFKPVNPYPTSSGGGAFSGGNGYGGFPDTSQPSYDYEVDDDGYVY